jgi:hypothetical protein
MPQKAAGMRTEPPMSHPSAKGTQPAATADPDPPDEPPGVRPVFQGFRVTPHSFVSVMPVAASSEVVVLPIMMAPAPTSRSTTTASRSGTQCSNRWEPRVVRLPRVGVMSLKAIGTPCSGPSVAPAMTARSAASARSIASSG